MISLFFNRVLPLAGLAGICCVIISCASPPPMIQEPVKRYFEVDAPLDTAWEVSLQALVEKGVIIDIIDKENHLMVVEEMLEGGAFQRTAAERSYFYSGLARVSLLFYDKGEKRTGVHINSVLQGFTGRYNVYVTSNGTLEKDYSLLIQNSLPVRKTYKWLEEDKGQSGGADGRAGDADRTDERKPQ